MKILEIMKSIRAILIFSIALLVEASVWAQSTTTERISFSIEDVSELFLPPSLSIAMEYVDENGNDALDALEQSTIKLHVINKGGKADNVKVVVEPKRTYPGLILPNKVYQFNVAEKSTHTVEIPMRAGLDVKGGQFELKMNVSDPHGYKAYGEMRFSANAYPKANLKTSGVQVIDAGKGTLTHHNNPDGMVQKGETVWAEVTIQNIGDGPAYGISYEISSHNSNVHLLSESGYKTQIIGSLGTLSRANTGKIRFRFSVADNFNGADIPLFLTVKEDKGFGNINEYQLPVSLDQKPSEPVIVALQEKSVRKEDHVTPVLIMDDQSEQRVINLKAAPFGEAIHQNAVAVVIGCEEYGDKSIPRAPYAKHDAEIMVEYFRNAMGISDVRILTDNQVTSMALKRMFDPEKGTLAQLVKAGKRNIFIYYSGHGTPTENNDVFLIPHDVDKAWIFDEGFSLNQMYDDLAALPAESVTVILDACFSGGSRPSDQFKSESVANQKFTFAKVSTRNQPWKVRNNFRVFTSSREDQASEANDMTMSGRFTCWVARGLQGEADKNRDGKVMMDELVSFVSANVEKETEGRQTPQFYGNSDFVVEVIK